MTTPPDYPLYGQPMRPNPFGATSFPNPAFDLIDNATDAVAYAIRKGLSQSAIDASVDQLARFLEVLK